MEISAHLHHIELLSDNVEDCSAFYARNHGLTVMPDGEKRICESADCRLIVAPGLAGQLGFVAFGFADETSLHAYREVVSARTAIEPADAPLLDAGAFCALWALLNWTPLLVMGKGLPKAVGINAIIAINVGGILGGLFISRMIDRFGVKLPMLLLYALMAVSLPLFANAQPPASVIMAAALVGFAVLGAQFSLYGVAPRLYPIAGRASGVGWAVAMGRIGSVTGPILIGASSARARVQIKR